ncbi:LysR family transcriptional regulator [Oxalobacteraceae bacterium CAVE-383]|nr:LysR family transcriptional regulator [Oxalobacteraceae bacterium CAVE-383]
MITDINLRHLRAFIAVAESGGVSQAAKAIYRAQSAISRSIHELESALGVELFERKASGMLPTAFGQALLYRGHRAANEFRQARDSLATRIRKAGGALNAPVFDLLFNRDRLQIFIALAESRHMQTVANLLGVTQPAVSAAIGELEASLGIPLFLRTAKGLVVNESGEILLLRAKLALAELRHVEGDIAALRGQTQGHVTVGADPLSRALILPRAIARVLERHPQVRISTIDAGIEGLAAQLRAGDLDFVLGTRPPGSGPGPAGHTAPDMVHLPLMTDKMSVFVRNDHPLTRLPKVTPGDLMRAEWILPARLTSERMLFDQAFIEMSGSLPKGAIETGDMGILRGLLLDSDLITAISRQQLDLEHRLGILRMLDFEFDKSERVIVLTQRAKSRPSSGSAALMAAIREVASEMAGI